MRPTLLTPERSKTILDLIASGNYIETACQAAGIASSTYHNWNARGHAERDRLRAQPDAEPNPTEVIYLEFLESVEKAFAEAEARNLMIIQKAAVAGTWQAAAWILERTRGRKYVRLEKAELSGPDGDAMKVNVSTEELERKIDKILQKQEGA